MRISASRFTPRWAVPNAARAGRPVGRIPRRKRTALCGFAPFWRWFATAVWICRCRVAAKQDDCTMTKTAAQYAVKARPCRSGCAVLRWRSRRRGIGRSRYLPPKIGNGRFSVRARQGFPEACSTRRNASICLAISGKCRRIRNIGRWFWGFCHSVLLPQYLVGKAV